MVLCLCVAVKIASFGGCEFTWQSTRTFCPIQRVACILIANLPMEDFAVESAPLELASMLPCQTQNLLSDLLDSDRDLAVPSKLTE
jgi:hypothetical protein